MSDEHYPEFTSAQTERLDEIDNAVYQTILAFLNKSEDEFPWDMYYIGEDAECIEEKGMYRIHLTGYYGR